MANAASRSRYDEDRWLSGRFRRGKQQAVTPAFLVSELEKLLQHLAGVDIYRMNKQLLKEYLVFLLQDQHMGVMHREGTEADWGPFVQGILKAGSSLPYYFEKEVLVVMKQAMAETAFRHLKNITEQEYRIVLKKARLASWMPWLMIFATLLACLAMFLFAQKR